jgi:hypothetical protein
MSAPSVPPASVVTSSPASPPLLANASCSLLGLFGKSWMEIDALVTPTKADDEQLQACFEAVQRVFSPLGSVLKAGSFGKGTHVKFKADVDAVVLFAAFSPAEHPARLKEIKATAAAHKEFTDRKDTSYSVQFRWHGIEVDVLPSMEHDDRVRYMQLHKGDQTLGACASPLQVTFIQSQPRRYRQLVRLVKWWKQLHKFPTRSALPLSYFLELLVLDVYNEFARVESTEDFAGLFQRVLEALLSNERHVVRFNSFYKMDQADVSVQNACTWPPALCAAPCAAPRSATWRVPHQFCACVLRVRLCVCVPALQLCASLCSTPPTRTRTWRTT